MTLAGGGQRAGRAHDVLFDIRRFTMSGERYPRLTRAGMWLHVPLITDEIVRLACSCVSNRVRESKFPLKKP